MKKICFVNGSPRTLNSTSEYFIGLIKEMINTNIIEIEDVYISKCLKTIQKVNPPSAIGDYDNLNIINSIGVKSPSEVVNNGIEDEALKSNTLNEAFKKIAESDSIIFVFPLYIDSIPSHMLEFLHQFDEYYKKNKNTKNAKPQDVYAVINNGFVEGEHNVTVVRIMQHYANSLGLNWRFGIGVGGGEFMRNSQNDVPIESKMKKNVYNAFLKLKKDIEDNEVACVKNIFTNPVMPKKMFIIAGGMYWVKTAKKNKVSKKSLYLRPWEV